MNKNEKIESMINVSDMTKIIQRNNIFDGFTIIEKHCGYALERIRNGIVDDSYIHLIQSELDSMKQCYNKLKTEEEKIQQLEALNK